MRCVRIWFNKTGRVKYISHLDLMRCMTRAVRRADIPLWYTEGFNPHPYLNFLLPLSLGAEGLCEPLDIRIEGEISNAEIKKRLNDVLPVGISVVRVSEPYMKPNDIALAEYEISFEKEVGLADKLNAAMLSGSLVCEKLGKINGRKKVKQVDISSGISKFSVEEDGERIILSAVLLAGNEKNVNPAHLVTAINNYLGEDIVPSNIIRIKLLDKNFIAFE